MAKVDSQQVFYLKGIYPVEVVSEVKDGFVEVRAKSAFLHTSTFTDEKVPMGVAKKYLVKSGAVLRVPPNQVWPFKRSNEVKCSDSKKYSENYDAVFRARYSRGRGSVCKRCLKALVEGDEIHVVNHGHKPRVYHKSCWEAMFF